MKRPDPEVHLMKVVVLQAIKDYSDLYSNKDNDIRLGAKKIRDWVINKEGTFDLCAVAMGVDEEVLQEMMLKVMNKIDQKRKTFPKYLKDIKYKDAKKERYV